MLTNCENCGAKVDKSETKCNYCGANLQVNSIDVDKQDVKNNKSNGTRIVTTSQNSGHRVITNENNSNTKNGFWNSLFSFLGKAMLIMFLFGGRRK